MGAVLVDDQQYRVIRVAAPLAAVQVDVLEGAGAESNSKSANKLLRLAPQLIQ